MYKAQKTRRQSLPGASSQSSSEDTQIHNHTGWSKHYVESRGGPQAGGDQTKKSSECLERLTSRTLSPAPETLPRKYSRSASILTTRHSLKDYLDKPRLVSTMGRRPSKVDDDMDSLIPGLSKLTSYYKQTFLNVCNTCDSLNHKNPCSPLNNNDSTPKQTSPHHRGM